MIVIVFGLPGSGKTYFAKALANELQFTHFNTDQLRKATTSISTPNYSKEGKEKIYLELLHKLEISKNAVIDGTFYKKTIREKFQEMAQQKSETLLFIEINASEELIKERTNTKRTDSDADYTVYEKIKEEFEPMTEPHLFLISERDNISSMIKQALNYIKNELK